jgi:hypothetical protein
MSQAAENPTMLSSLYEVDFYAWTQEQATLLRDQKWSQVDLANVLEEIESLGKQQRQELRNRLGILLGHLFKWQFQPDYRSKSWRATTREQRYRVGRLLDENPSLKPHILEAIAYGHELGLALVVQETSLDYSDLPENCPYLSEQILDDSFLPE